MTGPGSTGAAGGVSVLLMVVMLAWGGNIPAVKALTGVMDVAWVGLVRLGLATLALTVFLLVRDRRLPSLRSRDWAVLAVIAFLTIYLNQLLFVVGMRLSAAATASLVMALNPLLAVLAAALVLRERIGGRRAAGVVLGFTGVAVVVLMAPGARVGPPGLGELSLLAGLVVFISGGLLIQRQVRNLDVLALGWAIYLLGTAMLAVHALVVGGWERTAAAFGTGWVWWVALYSGVLGTALSNIGWYHAIGRVGQARAAPYLYWIAVFGVLSSAIALGEPLSWWHAIGLALLVAGVRLGASLGRAD